MTCREIIILTIFALCFFGCQSGLQSDSGAAVSRKQMDALKSAAKTLSGHEVTDDDIYRLADELKNNAENRSAAASVTDALTHRPVIYYCPVDGKRFAASVKECPQHHVKLELLE